MKKAGVIITIVLALAIVFTATGLTLAWFAESRSESGTIILTAAAPVADFYVSIRSLSQTGGVTDSLKPAVAALDANGAPLYASEPDFNFGSLDMTAPSVYISSPAKAVTVTMNIAYQGDPDSLKSTKTVVMACSVTSGSMGVNYADEFKFEASLYKSGEATNYNSDLDLTLEIEPYTMYTVSMKIYFKHFDDNVPGALVDTTLNFAFGISALSL